MSVATSSVSSHSHLANSEKSVRAMYYVQAISDPCLLPRLLQPFAKLGLIPDRVYADREWCGDKDLNVELRLLHINPQRAVLLEKSLAAIIGVKNVIAVIEEAM
ncbi:MAG: hypothetical protein AAF228_03645 [Pseudomonadota bacterium]